MFSRRFRRSSHDKSKSSSAMAEVVSSPNHTLVSKPDPTPAAILFCPTKGSGNYGSKSCCKGAVPDNHNIIIFIFLNDVTLNN